MADPAVSLRGRQRLTEREKLLRAITEDKWQRTVIGHARTFGWRTAHFRPLMTRAGIWQTPVQGDGKGFPDVILTKPPRLIVAELKREVAKVEDENQLIWLDQFRGVPGVEVYVWRPSDEEFVVATLSGRPIRVTKGALT